MCRKTEDMDLLEKVLQRSQVKDDLGAVAISLDLVLSSSHYDHMTTFSAPIRQ